ncbi:MAG: type II toxin-antitoxin system antitoxin, RelB/DinJ family [Oscillospiraceae bacterium]|nr:type II toxin-antitoxin system antitoxin, RelB/DinJ family [Oscillospiraceae bacterium]
MELRQQLINDIEVLPEHTLRAISVIVKEIVKPSMSWSNPNAETLAAIAEVEEMEKNPSLGKSYTDVGLMMKELLE